jgi:amino acid adenylation domain-containing protein
LSGPVTPTQDELARQRAALLASLLADEGLDDGDGAPRLSPRGATGPAPLSWAQEVLWLLDRASPGLTAYNTPIARRIRGPLDVAALQRAIDAMVARHDALRTVFAQPGEQPQQVARPATPAPFEVIDLRLATGDRDAQAIAWLRAIADTPFELTAEPPFRAALAGISDDDAILLLLTHHIASDAWSYGIMFRDLAMAYDATRAGREVAIEPAPLQFGDFATWQREQLRGPLLEARLGYWRIQLADQPWLELPTLRPVAAARGFSGARREAIVPASEAARLRAFAQAHGVTLYMMLLAAFQTVLHRYSGQDDITIGSAVAGRSPRATEEIVGYFSQALPMRTRFDGDPSFTALLARVADTVLGAFEHQDVPLEALVLELQRANPGAAPLFRVVLTMQDALATELQLGDCTVSPVELDASATKFDLTMLVSDRDGGLELALWYRTELFEAAAVDRLLGHVQSVLHAALAAPDLPVSKLQLLTPAETAHIAALEQGHAPLAMPPLLPAMIASHAARTQQSVAVVDGDVALTYGELMDRATTLAGQLQVAGVKPGALVGVALERSADAIVAIVGSWLAGAGYVPLVPDLPPARLAQQLDESGAAVIVTVNAHRDRLPATATVIALDADAPPAAVGAAAILAPTAADGVAYVLFTSGSTGTPKGVVVTHGNVAHYTAAAIERLDVPRDAAPPLTFATLTTLGADLGNTALFPALATGGTLHIIAPAVATDPARFADYLARQPIDLLKVTPGHLQALVAGRSGAALVQALPRRWLVLGGESVPWPLADTLHRDATCRIFNHYGPTETTVGAAAFELTTKSMAAARTAGAQHVPIGTPLGGAVLRVLDGQGQRAPVGVAGELYIGGPGVARGYLHQPERTAERFVVDPIDGGGRTYRTGDRVRWLENGTLEFLGRFDHQVKVRGYRVELGEIDQVIRGHAAVSEAVTLLRDGALVTFVVPRAAMGYAGAHAERLSAESVARFVAERLPAYMVPGTITLLDELPRTANGKINRARLAAHELPAAGAGAHVAPRTVTETTITMIWAEVFKRDRIGVTDEFLQLGGHSLLAIRILGKLTRAFGVRLPLRTLFDAPTVEQLAQVVDEAAAARAGAPA